MHGLDTLLAKSLDSVVRKHLGKKTVKVIENRLFEKYGTTLTQSIENFNQIDSVLREYFGPGAEGIEKKFLESICVLEKSKSNQEDNWVTLEDHILTKHILNAFGDEDKKKILDNLIGESKIISEVIESSGLSQTSGYRKIKSLIEDGLLVYDGFTKLQDSKIVQKYRAMFDNVKINIIGNKITVKVQVPRKNLHHSTILQIISSY